MAIMMVSRQAIVTHLLPVTVMESTWTSKFTWSWTWILWAQNSRSGSERESVWSWVSGCVLCCHFHGGQRPCGPNFRPTRMKCRRQSVTCKSGIIWRGPADGWYMLLGRCQSWRFGDSGPSPSPRLLIQELNIRFGYPFWIYRYMIAFSLRLSAGMVPFEVTFPKLTEFQVADTFVDKCRIKTPCPNLAYLFYWWC